MKRNIFLISLCIVFISNCDPFNNNEDDNDPKPSKAKELTTFSFTASANTTMTTDVTGAISGTDIAVTVLYGTDVTALIATFTTTGDLVTVGGTAQESGTTTNNFANPVIYTVTSEDGTTRDYTVTVTIVDNIEVFGIWKMSTWGYVVTFTNNTITFDSGYTGTILSYNNEENRLIMIWTNHPAYTGYYQKWEWTGEPISRLNVYSEWDTQTEAENDTVVKYTDIMTKL